MAIFNQIEEDYLTAFKAHDELKIATLRMLKSAIHNGEIQKKDKLTDPEIYSILNKEIKQRKDSIEQFKKGNRNELAQKEEDEIKILSSYLPDQLSDEEVEKIVNETISSTGAHSMSDFGLVMKEVMPKLKGKAEGEKVSQKVKTKLQGK